MTNSKQMALILQDFLLKVLWNNLGLASGFRGKQKHRKKWKRLKGTQ